MKLKIHFFALFIFTVLFGFASIKPAIADTVILSGTVQTASGSAIAGATVSVNDANNDSTTTDSNGNYSLSLPSGTYNVQVTPSGSGFSSAEALSQNISTNTTLNFILTPAGTVTLSGHLYDGAGTALANQTVVLHSDTTGQNTQATTDSTGSYSLQVPSDTYDIEITGGQSDPSYHVPQTYHVTVQSYSLTQSQNIDITIPAKEVDVYVQDATNAPVSGVEISTSGGLNDTTNLGDGITASVNSVYSGTYAQTDNTGHVTLWLTPNESAVPYVLTATPPSGSSYYTNTVSNINITGTTSETITLQQPVTLSGHLYDGAGTALANQTVVLHSDTTGQNTQATTDSTGSYSLQVPSDTYDIEITGGQSDPSYHVPQTYHVTVQSYSLTQSQNIDITIPAKEVDVYVQDATNAPVSGVEISTSGGLNDTTNLGDGITASVNSVYSGTYAQTDNTGHVTLWLTPNESAVPYVLTATPPSGSSYYTNTVSNINITGTTSETITLQQPVTLSGHLYDGAGTALANQTVVLHSDTTGQNTQATTDSTGSYSLQVPSDTYDIEITGGQSDPSYHVPQTYHVTVQSYSLTQSQNIDITIPAKEVDVYVQDATNAPVSGVEISTSGGLNDTTNLGDGITASVNSVYSGTYAQTDNTGHVTLWLTPNESAVPYVLTATPPSGSVYQQFISNNISVISNQIELISLQYNHATPVTTATLSPAPYSDGTYSDPTTVMLSGTAASGYSVASTYYKIDNGSQTTYTTPFTVIGSGYHTITYWSVDNSGVTEATNTKTFTISEAYTVSGTVYVDTNKNGFQDSGDQGYANATVTLNTGQSTTTDSNGNYSFPNLEAGSYTETLTLPSGYTATTTNPVSFALESNTTENFGIVQSLASAINAGGNTAGNYVADTDYNGGSTYSTSASIDTSSVSNPAPQAVYQSVRYGNFTYTIPNLTANGSYTVQLQFSEPYWGTAQAGGGGVGSRIFNVAVNGTQELSNFDVYAAAGGANKAVMEQIPATADSNGNIIVTFSNVVDNAMVSGIAVYNGTLPSPTPSPTPTPVTYEAISAGGQGSGNYVADTNYLGGSTYSTSASIDTSNVTNPAPQAVYQSVRYGNFSYTIPTYSPNTNYTVRMHFSEPYWQSAGSRLFNVSINGTQVLNNFDVYQTAGGQNTAVAEQFNTTSDSNGLINIQFNSVVDNAMVSGIDITQQ